MELINSYTLESLVVAVPMYADSALQELILDWPMDFVQIEGEPIEDIDEQSFIWNVNASARVERLRDFVGLENSNFMRVVGHAAEFVSTKMSSGKKPDAKAVCPLP